MEKERTEAVRSDEVSDAERKFIGNCGKRKDRKKSINNEVTDIERMVTMKMTEKEMIRKNFPWKIFRKGISLVLSCGLVLSATAFTGFSNQGQIALAEETEGDGGQTTPVEPTELPEPAESTELPTPAEQTDQQTGYTYILYDVTAEGETTMQKARITGYTGTDTDLLIPAKVGEYQVGSIGDGAFQENSDITSVTIAEGVTSIGYQAFLGCTKLARVTIPASITNWENTQANKYINSAFEGCTALTELILTEGLTTLGKRSFSDCTALETVTIPSTISDFRNQTFSGCTGLKDLKLTEGMTEMGFKAFEGCTALEEVTIPSTIQSWNLLDDPTLPIMQTECRTFENCTSLKKVNFTEGLESLKYFQGVRGCPLVKELDIPASVRDTDYAFSDCTYLERITFHEGLETLGQAAFQGCTSLQEVRLPGTVQGVKFHMFVKCDALSRIVVMPTASQIPYLDLSTCPKLKELDILSGTRTEYSRINVSINTEVYAIKGSDTYRDCLEMMTETGNDDMLGSFSTAGATVEGCLASYDGEEHDAVTVSGCQEDDEILYRICGEGEFTTEMPKLTEIGTYPVEVVVLRYVEGKALRVSSLTAQAEVTKKQCSILLTDVTAEEGKDYQLAPQGYQGDGEIVYTYYKDAQMQEICDGKPVSVGVYYVKATAAATDTCLAAESNLAKITITEKSGVDPTQKPSTEPTQEPSAEPTQQPSAEPTQQPSAEPTQKPSAEPTQKPSAEPTQKPSAEPTQKPGAEPTQKPGIAPTQNPAVSSGVTPEPVKKPQIKKASLKKVVSPGKKKLDVTWKKLSGVTGYQVQVATNRKFTKGKKTVTIKKAKTIKYRFKKLGKQKKYYVRLRAYKTVQGKRYYGSWSGAKTAKVK